MDMVVCPHCKTHRLVTSRVPKDVIVVMPCPSCHELAVLFRNRVIPLNRKVLERGTFEERKTHLAEVIAHFLEAGVLPFGLDDMDEEEFGALEAQTSPSKRRAAQRDLISQEEMERFTRIELKRLDNPAYFRRHFG